jgi:hypothetical protein
MGRVSLKTHKCIPALTRLSRRQIVFVQQFDLGNELAFPPKAPFYRDGAFLSSKPDPWNAWDPLFVFRGQ